MRKRVRLMVAGIALIILGCICMPPTSANVVKSHARPIISKKVRGRNLIEQQTNLFYMYIVASIVIAIVSFFILVKNCPDEIE
jgi:flagellar biosynthesis protein FliP